MNNMLIQETINIQDESLIYGLVPVVELISKIETVPDEEEVVLDFSKANFVSPVFVVSMMAYCAMQKRLTFLDLPSYFTSIHFNSALEPDRMRSSEFKALIEKYSNETYIPVVSFPAETSSVESRDNILSVLIQIIIKQENIQPNVANGVRYMISELVDNVTEHSGSDRGYIFAQAYPQKKYLDICIADNGIGLLRSYLHAGIEIEDEIEAIKAANSCLSSKNLPDAENRGYGIFTSKKMLVEGLQGQYLMVSGNAVFFKNQQVDQVLNLPVGMRWGGTLVALRIPYSSPSFNYISYVE